MKTLVWLSILGWAFNPATAMATDPFLPAPRQAPTQGQSIPRLPSLEDLQKIVAAGAPTERLKNLPRHDESSACEILLQGSGASLLFENILVALKKAGISAQNLTFEEKNFLIAATSLHIAGKLEQRNFRDVDGYLDLLNFLGVQRFELSDAYLAVVKFWLNAMPESHFFLHNSVRIDMREGELDYSGVYFRKRVIEMDPEKLNALREDFIQEDYRQAILQQTGFGNRLTAENLKDFMRVREVLYALRSNYSLEIVKARLAQVQNLQGLVPLLKRD